MKFKSKKIITTIIFIFGLMDIYCVDEILYKFGEPDEEFKDLINPSRKRKREKEERFEKYCYVGWFMYNSDCDRIRNKETRKSLDCDSFLILKNYFCVKGKAGIIPYMHQ